VKDNEKIAIFLSNDKFSEYTYRKLEKNYLVIPFSFERIEFTDTEVLSPYNFSEVVEFFVKEGIKKVLLIGRISPSILFKGKFDFLSNKILSSNNWKSEEIVKNIIAFLENRGVEILSLKKIFNDELAEKKVYCGKVERKDKKDIETGYAFLRDVEKYRCGQSASVKNGMIIAVEGIEGTDEMIKRIEANGKVIAVESGKTIIFDKEKVINQCKKAGITFLGI